MYYYNILGWVGINDNKILWDRWTLFQHEYVEMPELQIDFKLYHHIEYGLEVLENQQETPVLKSGDCLLYVNKDWRKANLTLFAGRVQYQAIYKLLNALFLTYLSTRQAIEMHASLVQTGDTGVMFLGPSCIGKTTQAELWMQYRGAEIINGDMVFVKKEEDRFLGCGSPWHGSSPYCLNKQVPLSALIVLKQSKQNTIRRLTGFEMVSSVMSSVFWPTWYREGYEAACETFDTLLNTVPVYELSCRPDEDAVKLTEETIFGG